MNNSIHISFKIHYQTFYSYALYISGSSKELGCWDPLQAIRLNWNQGNWWTGGIVLSQNECQFDYKFFVAKYDNPNQEMKWEQGPNRSINTKGYTKRHIEIVDVWEFKKVILRLFENSRTIPCGSPQCQSTKCISLSKSSSSPIPPPQMISTKDNYSFNQLKRKESIEIPSTPNGSTNNPAGREHSSSISSNSTSTSEEIPTPDTPEKCSSSNNLIKERYYVTASIDSMGNMMKLQKMKKHTIRTLFASNTNHSEQKEIVYWEKQFLVKSSQQSLKYKYAYKSETQFNDQMERKSNKINFSKNDVDFQGAYCLSDKWQMNDFCFDQITSTISLGPYPENQEQIKLLSQGGVKAVFNLQTEEDMLYHGTNWENIKNLYAVNGIKVVHYPVTDMDVHDMALKLRDAVDQFALSIKKYNHVYIHCTSGIYRSPQVIVAYLHLYQNIDVNKAIQLVEAKRPITKKNRDYLRQVYALKGGYGKTVKLSSAETFKEITRKAKQNPRVNQFTLSLPTETSIPDMPQPLSKKSYSTQQEQSHQSQFNQILMKTVNPEQELKMQIFQQKQQQLAIENLLNKQAQQKMYLSQQFYSLEEVQSIKKKYFDEQQSSQFSSFHISLQNLSAKAMGLRESAFWNQQSSSKELQRRRHSLLNSFQYETNSQQIWA